jgi:7-carboxy-7-deazaguanine synthase
MKNNQPIEKSVSSDGSTLDVHSIFLTIQGEGPFSGERAVFVRLAGCNLQCPFCDTQYTEGRATRTVQQVIDEVRHLSGHKPILVVITGGEPFRQNLSPILKELERREYLVQIETNGTLPVSDHTYVRSTVIRRGTYIICSPKTGKVHSTIEKYACAFKYVIDAKSVDPDDGLPILALGHTANPRVYRPQGPRHAQIFVQPMDEDDPVAVQANLDATIRACIQYGYTLQLQIHKLMGIQ